MMRNDEVIDFHLGIVCERARLFDVLVVRSHDCLMYSRVRVEVVNGSSSRIDSSGFEWIGFDEAISQHHRFFSNQVETGTVFIMSSKKKKGTHRKHTERDIGKNTQHKN